MKDLPFFTDMATAGAVGEMSGIVVAGLVAPPAAPDGVVAGLVDVTGLFVDGAVVDEDAGREVDAGADESSSTSIDVSGAQIGRAHV